MAATAILLALAAVPPLCAALAQPYYLTLFARVMILGLAAMGLNLVLGFGGLVSFGHAMYIGVGAYAVGILDAHGVTGGLFHLAAALAAGAALACFVGTVCLLTRGIAFIMITLAFAQMVFFLAVGLKEYGGDDGLSISARSAFGPLHLDDPTILYYAIFAVLLLTLLAGHRLVHSRFGMVLRGAKLNERRMAALGFPVRRYQLTAYVISALVCVLSGFLLANLTRFVSPAYMQWQVSGELIVMAVLGGTATVLGPLVGAAILLLIEEALAAFAMGLPVGVEEFVRDHRLGALGLLIVLAAVGMRRGVYGALAPSAH